MREIKRVVEIKCSKGWGATHTDTDPASVYEHLSRDLIAKKINACTYIRSIKRSNNYDGTQTIVVTYDTATRSVYTVAN